MINNNKPNNLKRYKCDSCVYALIQKGILTEHTDLEENIGEKSNSQSQRKGMQAYI